MNKKDTILYLCSWTCCFAVISVYKSGLSGAGVMFPSVPRQQSKKHE